MVNKRVTNRKTMYFHEWEVDDSIWEKTAEAREVQELVPVRRARLMASAEDKTHMHTLKEAMSWG